jgi:hypothetical protein
MSACCMCLLLGPPPGYTIAVVIVLLASPVVVWAYQRHQLTAPEDITFSGYARGQWLLEVVLGSCSTTPAVGLCWCILQVVLGSITPWLVVLGSVTR